ncbi:MAG: hemolysin III family protein [Acidocella sp.]|nr:hemolysin III family protein [Acidocella sp.]
MAKARGKMEALSFPKYSKAEWAVDLGVHIIGVPSGVLAGVWLVVAAAWHGGVTLNISIAAYVAGLIGMLAASAAYQLCPHGLRKERLRRLDRAMIFVMIAGTYTPISVNVLAGQGGTLLCAIQWLLAAIGVFITLKFPRRFERAMLGLYMAMGWMLLVLIHYCFALLRPDVLVLIFAGGIAYTVGAAIHTDSRLKFHNPIWHFLILIAATCQYLAIYFQLFS